MKCNALFVLLLIISPVVWAKETPVNLGHQTLFVSQPLDEVFAEQSFILPPLCEKDCSDVAVKWTPMATLRNNSVKGTYLFDSGIKGIAIRVTTDNPEGPPSAGQSVSFKVGLVKISKDVEAGKSILSQPLLKWSLLNKKGGELPSSVQEAEGTVVVSGDLAVGGCEVQVDSRTLSFNLPSVSIKSLKGRTPGEPVPGISDGHPVVVECTVPVSSVSAAFSAETIGNPEIIKAGGAGSGVGFILKGGDNKNDSISWDNKPHPLPVPGSGGISSYLLTAFYTPTGEAVEAGDISATGTFTITYQ